MKYTLQDKDQQKEGAINVLDGLLDALCDVSESLLQITESAKETLATVRPPEESEDT